MTVENITTYPTASELGKFKEEVIEAPKLGDYDMLIKLLACGVCHSDHNYMRLGEGVILGHEPVGRVTKVGAQVKRLQIGDIVGTSFLRNACLDCSECNSGADNMCNSRIMFPGRDNLKYNGFADHMVADSRCLSL
jgi:uncharacterized zinc-type alcohol dehydrogenase-like protein